MISLLIDIALYLILVFLLGILFGWVFWGRGRAAALSRARAIEDAAKDLRANDGDAQALTDALGRLNAEKSKLQKRVAELEGR